MKNQIVESTTENIVLTSANAVDSNKSPIMSKALKNYYKHREQRIAYQKDYDLTHKERKKAADDKRYQNKKSQKLAEKQRQQEEEFKQAEKIIYIKDEFRNKLIPRNIEIIKQFVEREIRKEKGYAEIYNQIQKLEQLEQLEQDSLNHVHGKPRKEDHERYGMPKGLLDFHFKKEIIFFEEHSQFGIKEVRIETEKPEKRNYGISGKQYSGACCIYLGLTAGDSLVFKDEYGTKCQICFDGSGLDIADIDLFMQFMSIAAETGKKGVELIRHFASHYSKDGYVQYYRGNKKLLNEAVSQ